MEGSELWRLKVMRLIDLTVPNRLQRINLTQTRISATFIMPLNQPDKHNRTILKNNTARFMYNVNIRNMMISVLRA